MPRRLGTVASWTAWKALLLRCSWHRRAHLLIGVFSDRRVTHNPATQGLLLLSCSGIDWDRYSCVLIQGWGASWLIDYEKRVVHKPEVQGFLTLRERMGWDLLLLLEDVCPVGCVDERPHRPPLCSPDDVQTCTRRPAQDLRLLCLASAKNLHISNLTLLLCIPVLRCACSAQEWGGEQLRRRRRRWAAPLPSRCLPCPTVRRARIKPTATGTSCLVSLITKHLKAIHSLTEKFNTGCSTCSFTQQVAFLPVRQQVATLICKWLWIKAADKCVNANKNSVCINSNNNLNESCIISNNICNDFFFFFEVNIDSSVAKSWFSASLKMHRKSQTVQVL